MVARSVITVRQKRLGRELRKLRELAGLGLREAARATGINEGKLSNVEAGRVGVSSERVRFLASHYGVGDAGLVDALAAMAAERGRGWWEEHREAVPAGYMRVAELEHHAVELRTFQTVHVPGLLQTEKQMRGIFASSVPSLSEEQREARVRFRLRRQEVLGSVTYAAVVHEAALRLRAADREVAREQLLHILEQSERSHVSVRVVPFDVDGFAGISNPVTYANGSVPQLDTVLVDTQHGGAYLDAEAQLNRYRTVLATIEKVALSAAESRDFIEDLVRQS
ncbi:transcriptional regulator [Streptomyces ruber]|uniref:Transcriptional regulator n=2 Tax=Streptomyces TaxID=1883 RepID=A0A918EWE6_9ACTN|nr:helix-turn-helix transcriptional regulator [Streptomyces ruber]GGQ77763.1 transcriptional regulator [Streptomyces ruber]